MIRRSAALGAAALFALAAATACKTPIGATASSSCDGTPPECYVPVGDGCCAQTPIAAECGPKDAPLGTHLKWICPDKSMAREECRGVGAACTPKPPEKPAEVRAPHAAVELEVFDPDASTRPGDAGAADAGKRSTGRGGRRGH